MKVCKEKFCSMEDLYLSSYKLVYSFIKEYTNDRLLIEEISSIVWLKITKNPKKYLNMEKQKLFNYLKIMIKTTYIDYYNAQIKEIEKLKDYYENKFEELHSDNIAALLEADYKYLKEAICILTDEEKELIILKYKKALSYNEIAKMYGTSAGSLRTKQSRIYDKLRNEIVRLRKESEC